MYSNSNATLIHAAASEAGHGALYRMTAPFTAISLDQLNTKADMLERRDNKYIMGVDVLGQAMGKLARYFDILEINGRRKFSYDTCYFDDADYSSYFDHHRGRRIRCKVRMRKYVDAGLCFVEVKLKHKRGMTIKERLGRPVTMHGVLDDTAVDFIHAVYSDLYKREFQSVLQPVMDMYYHRITLVAKEGGERVTVDADMAFVTGNTARTVPGDMFLVEVKSANANGIADKILRSLHQHSTNSCSKYCVAMATLEKVSKYNKFLTALRQLNIVPVNHGTSEVPWGPVPLVSSNIISSWSAR